MAINREMKIRHIYIILLLTLHVFSYSQGLTDDKSVKWKFEYHAVHLPLGVVYQNEILYQAGQRIAFRKKREAISFCLNAQIQFRNATYLSPTLLINYYKPIYKSLGPSVNLEYSYRKIQGITCNTVTPEVGICLYWFSLNCGYNISLDNSFPWTTPFRLSLRLIEP